LDRWLSILLLFKTLLVPTVTLGILTFVNGHPCDSDTNLIVRGLYGTMLWPLGFKVKYVVNAP
jgi:hypothetical protein